DVAGRPLYERVVEKVVERFPRETTGFVVGATYPEETRRLRAIAPDRVFLLPGVGAQGGDIETAVRAAMDRGGDGVIPSASRSVLCAPGGGEPGRRAAAAALALREAANAARAAAMAS